MGRPKGSKNKPASDGIIDALMEDPDAHVPPPAIKGHGPLELRSMIEEWIEDGTACKYVRFCTIPVSPAQGKEPVWEFKLEAKTKYSVDSMVFHDRGGLVFSAYGEKCVVALGNIGYWRPL